MYAIDRKQGEGMGSKKNKTRWEMWKNIEGEIYERQLPAESV